MNKNMMLLVTYRVKPGMRDEFVRELYDRGIHEAVNNEDGCIKYDYYLDAADENRVLLVEIWESKEKQEAHLTTPHMALMREIKEKYAEDTLKEEY